MISTEERLEGALGARLRRVEGSRLSDVLTRSFLCVAGRIDWRRARDVSEKLAPPERAEGANLPGGAFQTSDYVAEVEVFLMECMRRHGLRDEWVGFIGDSMHSDYEVQLSVVPDLLRMVCDIPDHKYIFALDGAWCMMWSFEDDLYLGFRP